jgi:outer membrane protein assembly factor BamD (BamD/ComL family)
VRAVVAPAAGEDATAVSAAMRALRVEHNSVRARSLLLRYLAEHPNGNLAEEALALSIEAALAHHDTDAAALARRYLRLYPQGAFAGLAQRADASP